MISDRLNPVLVKELRAGLRTGGFVWAFTGVQACMALLFVLHVAQRARDPSGGADWVPLVFVWLILGAVLYVVFPVLGLQGLRGEMRDRKLELMLLAGLRANPLIRGKWFALLCQEAVLLVSVMPYFVLRYYLGGADFVLDLFRLFFLLLYGSISLALSIGISAAKWSDVHSLFLMLLVFCIPGLVGPIVALGETGLLVMVGAGVGVYVAAGLPLTFLGWSMALSFIEEHARPG